jgi:hypothetical protein
MATHMVADATKAKADFEAKMNKQKLIYTEGSLVKTNHKHFDLYEMVHPELGVGEDLINIDHDDSEYSLASVYNSRRISIMYGTFDTLQKVIDRKIFVLDHQINEAKFIEVPQTNFASIGVEVA